MPTKPRRALVAIVLALASATVAIHFSRLRAAESLLEQPITSEIPFTEDTLPNGLRYYISKHSSATERIELRLVIDAGALQESAEERGLAHAVEHMLFRGTRRFPHASIDRYFESIGMRAGDDVNATTAIDNTIFRMAVPDFRPGAIDTALAMLASMASEATFDAAETRREAGVLLEEWRLSRGSSARMTEARNPLLFAGTAYATHPTAGDTVALRTLSPETLRRFYENWYRPEFMAIVVVGNFFDAKVVKEAVRKHFGAIPVRKPRLTRPDLPELPATRPMPVRALVVNDPEAWNSSIDIWHPRARQRYQTYADYRDALIAMQWVGILHDRLRQAALRPGGALLGADVNFRTLSRRIGAEIVEVTPMKGRTLAALDAVIGEMRELARTGPTSGELRDNRRSLLRGAHTAAQIGETSAEVADELAGRFLSGNALVTNGISHDMTEDLLPTITARDIQAYARERTVDAGDLIAIAAAASDTVRMLSPAAILALADATQPSSMRNSDREIDVEQLLESKTKPGQVVSQETIADIKTYRWTLSNGMHVLLKPSSFTYDEVKLRAIAPGGASLAPDSTYASAYLADGIIGATGVGRISAPRLDRWLAGSSVSLETTVSDDAITFDGQSTPSEIEALLQLLHLYLTSPRRDTVAFRRYQARSASTVQDRGRDPDAVFDDTVAVAFANGDVRALKHFASFYERVNLDEALDFWKDRTSNGANLTVAIAGDFTLDRVRPLIERYLASIPAGATEYPRERSLPSAALIRVHEIAAGEEERARTVMGFSGPFEMSNVSWSALGAVRDLIERVVEERLRNQMGGTYYVNAGLSADIVPPFHYTITFEFASAPERTDALIAAATKELVRLRESGPTEAEFRAVREARIRDLDGWLEDNSYWVSELISHSRYGWPLTGISAHTNEAEAMTIRDLKEACAKYIPAAESHVRVTMRPRVFP